MFRQTKQYSLVCNFAVDLKKEPVIEVVDLYKSYKGFDAVNGINFTVYKGDVFGFLGPNGAGKSTTIRMLMSLIRPTSGDIRIFGKSLFTNREFILSKIGAIVEKPDLYDYLSLYDNIRLLSRVSGKVAGKGKILELLELVGLKDRANSKIKTFSHGMKQRAGIAQALIHDPELIILDEPTTGLDPQGIIEIRELIIRLSRDFKKTVLLSSHILNEVELVANRMVIINKGKVAVEGEVQVLLNTDEMKVTLEVSEVEKALLLIKSSEFRDNLREVAGTKIIFRMKKNFIPELNRLMTENNIDVRSIIPMRSLEEYFLTLT